LVTLSSNGSYLFSTNELELKIRKRLKWKFGILTFNLGMILTPLFGVEEK
jgi:hypothetical protein